MWCQDRNLRYRKLELGLGVGVTVDSSKINFPPSIVKTMYEHAFIN